MAIVCFVLVAVVVCMILLCAYMSLMDWRKKHAGELETRPDSLEGTLTALGKLADAIKTYPRGQQLIVWGIVVVIIGGLFGGISGLLAA
jgi:uncharacterized membrane protein